MYVYNIATLVLTCARTYMYKLRSNTIFGYLTNIVYSVTWTVMGTSYKYRSTV